MRERKKFIPHLTISFLALVGLVLLVITFNPARPIDFSIIAVSPVIPFFLFTFLSVAGIFGFLFAKIRRGIFIALFVVFFLLLQLLRLNNFFYNIILIAIFSLLEFYFWKKN